MRFKQFINESNQITYKVVNEDELYKKYIYKSKNYDEYFKDLQKRIKFFGSTHSSQTFILALDNDKIVGILKLGIAAGYNDKIKTDKGVYFLSVDPAYQNKGVGKSLVKEMFELANQDKFSLHLSSYTKEERKYLFPTIENMKKQYPTVKVYDSVSPDYD